MSVTYKRLDNFLRKICSPLNLIFRGLTFEVNFYSADLNNPDTTNNIGKFKPVLLELG